MIDNIHHRRSVDPRTACYWQRNIEDEDYMVSSFKKQMAKLAVLGQDTAKLIDCSEVIPVPKPRKRKAHLPAGTSLDDIEASVRAQVQFHEVANSLDV
jgi:cytochrome c peroxidase